MSTGPFVRVIHQPQMYSLQKRSVMWKGFPYNDVIMKPKPSFLQLSRIVTTQQQQYSEVLSYICIYISVDVVVIQLGIMANHGAKKKQLA